MALLNEALQTMTDREVAEFAPGVVDRMNREAAARAAAQPQEQPRASAGRYPSAVTWARLMERNPEYDADLWQELRALYSGGPRLLRNETLMRRLFPPHRAEDPAIYRERVARASYFPYSGTIIDALVAGLAVDPVTVEVTEGDATGRAFWGEFVQDVSPEGGLELSLQTLMTEAVREALITRRSWILVDLPQTPEEYVARAPESLLEQERAGLLDPYAAPIVAENVIDWQMDQGGELEFALVRDVEQRRESLADSRENITETFTWYDREGWARYRVTYPATKPPKPADLVPMLDQGRHPFGKVPLVQICLAEGLHAMAKLESLAREHLNKRNAVSWAEFKSLFAVLYEFLAPEEGSATQPISDAQGDPDRAISQTFGPGHSQLRGHQDDARYIGPDVGPFEAGRESCAEVMREMFRVMHSMALAADVGGAALRRSGESKKEDRGATSVVLAALGKDMREATRRIASLVAELKQAEVTIGGARKFTEVDIAAAVKEAVDVLNGLPQHSPTFTRTYLAKIYRLLLGDQISDKDAEAIREELELALNPESMMLGAPSGAPADEDAEDAEEGPDDAEQDEDAEDEREVVRARAAGTVVPKEQRRRLFDSRGR